MNDRLARQGRPLPGWRDSTFAAGAPFANIRRVRTRRRGPREEPSFNEPDAPNVRLPTRLSMKPMSGRLVGLSSMATRHILADLARDYEARRGTRVEIRSMGGVEAAKLVRAGEAADVVVLASKVMAALEAEGHLAKGGTKNFARSEIGIAVRAGSPAPGIASEQAVKQAMLDARRICYSTGPSGDHLKALCETWGLAESVLGRALVAPPGTPVADLVGNGDADLGFQQLSELIDQPGVEVVGPLPPEIQAVTVFSAGVSSKSADPEAARALVAFLASPETAGAKRRYGMEPA
jgi:molybdate transport system substrate-binding protein